MTMSDAPNVEWHGIPRERLELLETVVQNLASQWHADHCGEETSARPGFSRRTRPHWSWRECASAHCRMAQSALGITRR
jgi:hypothetical protein